MNDAKNCVFCKIVLGSIPATKIMENETFLAIKDLNPQARDHVLIIPKSHVRDLVDLNFRNGLDESEAIKIEGQLLQFAAKVSDCLRLNEQGFRCVINTRQFGGQTVHHLHMHLLGGEPLSGAFGA